VVLLPCCPAVALGIGKKQTSVPSDHPLVEVMAMRAWREAMETTQGVVRVRSKRASCYLIRDGPALTLVKAPFCTLAGNAGWR
jgi:hypothetical protein